MLFTGSLKNNSSFIHIYRNGRYFVGKHIVLYALKVGEDRNELGVTAGKKVGKSVRRNRIKRLIKENYRLYEPFIHTGFRLVFVVRAARAVDMAKSGNAVGKDKSGNTVDNVVGTTKPCNVVDTTKSCDVVETVSSNHSGNIGDNGKYGSLPDFYTVRKELKSLLTRAGAFDHQRWENSRNGV